MLENIVIDVSPLTNTLRIGRVGKARTHLLEWEEREDESDLSVDWAEAEEICWRCGCKRKLQRCHIIPDSLGGKDEPSNLVLLCERCHIDAPNVESQTFM